MLDQPVIQYIAIYLSTCNCGSVTGCTYVAVNVAQPQSADIPVRNLLVLPNKIVLLPKTKIEARAARTRKSLPAEISRKFPC